MSRSKPNSERDQMRKKYAAFCARHGLPIPKKWSKINVKKKERS